MKLIILNEKLILENYTRTEIVSPNQLNKKTFKFGHSKAWVTTWMRDDYRIDEWGKVSESAFPIYSATAILNNLKKDGWKNY